MIQAELALVNVQIVGLTVACHRWQIALIGVTLIARTPIKEALKYDPLQDDRAAALAAALAGYRDVPLFVAEQKVITERLEFKLSLLVQRRKELIA